MTRSGRATSWALLGLMAVFLLGVATFDSSGPAEGDERIQHLQTLYACPQCDGQAVSESNAAVAATIRDFIRIKVNSGATDQEIRDELIRAYGGDVLLTPPAEGISLLIWILPVVVAVGGSAFVVLILRRRSGGLRSATDADTELVAEARRKAGSRTGIS